MIPIERALADDLLRVLSGLAEDQSYGVAMLADDPRDFVPDPECCSPEELAAHAEAVKRAEAGEPVELPRHYYRAFGSREEAARFVRDTPGVHAVTFAGPGKPSHVNVQTWGMGTSIIRDPGMQDLRDRLDAAVRAHEAANPSLPGLEVAS